MHFIDELKSYFSASQLLIDQHDKQPFERDWRGRYQQTAIAVVFPKTVSEVAWLVTTCLYHQIKIVPQSGNTSLCGGSIPIDNHSSIILNLSKLNRIRKIDLDNDTITVDAGVILSDVSQYVHAQQRLFPLSMASEGTAQIGGVISTNAGGTAVIRYGNMRSQVLGLEVVLADGSIWNGLNQLRKDNTGYDLKQLFIGAEGTLGVITGAVLKLYPLPKTKEVYWLTVKDLKGAIKTLSYLKNEIGEHITAFEIVSTACLNLLHKHFPSLQIPSYEEGNWAILIELDFFSVQTDHDDVFMPCIDNQFVIDVIKATNENQQHHFWNLREHIPLSEKLEGFSVKHDISVPISAIPEFVDNAIKKMKQHFPNAVAICFGHLGDGNLHFNFASSDPDTQSEFLAATPIINKIIYDLVYEYGGSLSAEHGIGQLKVDVLKEYKSKIDIELMKTIKQSLDPQNLFNPGKVVS